MTDRIELARLYTQAQSQTSEAAVATIKECLAESAILKLPRSVVSGKNAIIEQLANPDSARSFRQASWSEPEAVDAGVRISGQLPLVATLGGYNLRFEFDDAGKISRIEQQNLPAPPLPPSEVKLTEDIKRTVNNALANATPIIVACVDQTGQALLSLRGTVQAFRDDQLAFWARNSEGGTLQALDSNPKLTIFYRDPRARTTYTFYGRGWVTKDAKDRLIIFDNSPEGERNADPERRGVAIIVDIDRVEGAGPDGRVRMMRGVGEQPEPAGG